MAENFAEPEGLAAGAANRSKAVTPTFWTALPHFLPLAIFPLIINAALHGGWWIAAPFVFFMLAGPLDIAFGADERNIDPLNTSERRLFWHNLPVWLWALLWPTTLVFGLWQILIAGELSIWEGALMAVVLTGEAQAVFIVGHELIHRRSLWERRLGEFLLASAPPTRNTPPSTSIFTMPLSARRWTWAPRPKAKASGTISPGRWRAT